MAGAEVEMMTTMQAETSREQASRRRRSRPRRGRRDFSSSTPLSDLLSPRSPHYHLSLSTNPPQKNKKADASPRGGVPRALPRLVRRGDAPCDDCRAPRRRPCRGRPFLVLLRRRRSRCRWLTTSTTRTATRGLTSGWLRGGSLPCWPAAAEEDEEEEPRRRRRRQTAEPAPAARGGRGPPTAAVWGPPTARALPTAHRQ